jgi:hypothetical protein
MEPEDRAMVEALWRDSRRHQLDDFLDQGAGCGWCRHPIRLRGYAAAEIDGERRVAFTSASLPDGVVLTACGSVRARAGHRPRSPEHVRLSRVEAVEAARSAG